MKKWIVGSYQEILFIAAGLLVSYLLPWWSITAVGFAIGLLSTTRRIALVSGLRTLFLVWFGVAVVIHLLGHGTIAPRMAQLFYLPWWPLIFLVTGLIAGVIGLLSAWLGYNIRELVVEMYPRLRRKA